MKKINALFISIITIYVLSLFMALSGCKSHKPIVTSVKDSTIVKYSYKDTTITLHGDTVRIETTVPCPEAKWEGYAKSGKTTLHARIDSGQLRIDCHQDSLLLRITWLEKELERKTTTTVSVPVPVEVIRYRAPWWAKITLWFSLICVAWLAFTYRKRLAKLIQSIIKLFL